MSISLDVGDYSVLPLLRDSDGSLVIWVQIGHGEYAPVVSVSPDGTMSTPLPELDAYFKEEDQRRADEEEQA